MIGVQATDQREGVDVVHYSKNSKRRISMSSSNSQLFEVYREDLRRYISKMLACPADVEDVLQETYCRVYARAAQSEKQAQNPRAYIFVTAANLIKDFLRNRLKSERREGPSVEDTSLLSTEPNPENEIISARLKRDMLVSLERLNPTCRQVFVMHRYQHLSHSDIAEQLGISVRTVERRMRIAIDHFRNQLREYL